ncbi:hypothetical protein MIMGU_mgv1a011635mg [Erythranthe guttata]|uniref:Uncharacterized protein n=1 Tax=Erythranthe guttata TaxID=4155 RepID=A0A022PYI5_ERYGU|nr:hypothetical protein MIMGU_mgv1a011635mg [Erythranthe guttata]
MFFTLPELRMFLPRKLHQGMDFRHYVNRLPKDAALTVVADSCSSGGLIDQEPVQVGLPYHPRPQKSCHPRILPYDAYLAQLSSKTGLNSPDIGVHLVKLFDSEASILFRLRPDQHPKPLKADQGILLSGCEPDQNTVEDWDENGSPCGAFTKQLVIKARGILGIKAENERQHPCLYCTRKNVNAVFLLKTTARAEIPLQSQLAASLEHTTTEAGDVRSEGRGGIVVAFKILECTAVDGTSTGLAFLLWITPCYDSARAVFSALHNHSCTFSIIQH